MAEKPSRLLSSNHVKHATALVQKAEKEAAQCDAAVSRLDGNVLKMEEALERAQEKAQAASGCFGACFGPPEIPTDHPMVQRITQTKKMADSLTVRRLALRLQAEKVNKLVASLAEEVSGQRNWRTFFPDHRLQDLVNTALELEQYLASSTVAQQAAMGSAPTTLNGAPGQPDEADLLEEPRAPPMPQEPIIIQQRLKPECPLCLDSIEVLACGPCGHVFCNDCIRNAVQKKTECPICRHRMTVRQIHKIFMD